MIGEIYERVSVVPRAIGIAFASRLAIAATAAVFLIIAAFYAMLLPAIDTGGAIGRVSLRFLTPGELALSLVMALLLALTLALSLQGMRQGAGARPTGGVLGAILATLPALLCCSPVLPLSIAAMAAVLPAAGSFGLPIQGFIATHEPWFYGVAVALMGWGLYGSARRVLSCNVPKPTARNLRRASECCEPPVNDRASTNR
jgi:hypothetical protein